MNTSPHAPRVALVCLALVATATAGAQQRFEATVSRVRVDVIVHDNSGGFVDDLSIDDFRVLEDGEPQDILSVQLVDLANSRLVDRSRSATDPAAALVDISTTLEAGRDPSAGQFNQRSSDFGAMVFVVDFQGLDFANKMRFTEAWENLIAQTEHLDVPRAVYVIDQVGRLTELSPLTQDPEQLLAAAQEVNDMSNVRRSLRDQMFDSDTPADLKYYEQMNRATYTYDLLTQFANGLVARSGRTAMIWVSAGVTLMYENAFTTGTIDENARPVWGGSPNPRILQRQEAFHRAANSANVSVYTVDPTPKIQIAAGMADVRFGTVADGAETTPLGDANMASIELDQYRNSLRLAANATGGRSFIAWANLTEVLREIEQDTGRYYLLTYASPTPDGDGDYHRIDVEVARDNLEVRAREGYIDYTQDDRRSRFVSAALSLPGTVADIPLYAQVTRSWTPDGQANVLLTAAVDASHVGLTVDAEGPLATFEVHAAALNSWLELQAEHHGELRRRLQRNVIDIPGGTLTLPTLPEGELLVYRYEWPFEPGEYDLRVMVMDETNGRVGSAKLDLVVPDVDPGAWHTSDLVLIETDAASNRRPVVAGHIPEGRAVAAFVEVYNGGTPFIGGYIAAIDNPRSALAAGAEVFLTPLYADTDGVFRGAAMLPPMTPGRYALEINIEDGRAAQSRTFETELVVAAVSRRAPRD